jgi:hypothetical protein
MVDTQITGASGNRLIIRLGPTGREGGTTLNSRPVRRREAPTNKK